MKRDIVYILKKDIDPQELRFSLRSVAECFPCRFVWFVGAVPSGFQPDKAIEHEQTGGTKWERVKSSLLRVCADAELSDEFFLFNDDFFVLRQPTGEFVNMTDGTIGRRIREIVLRSGNSNYTRQLKDLDGLLKLKGCDTISFAVHVPFLVNKADMLELLKTGKYDNPMFRGLYGNVYNVPYIYHKDVKIYDMETEPGEDWDYLSTTEQSFACGKVGAWIRERFPNPCKYETEVKKNEQ